MVTKTDRNCTSWKKLFEAEGGLDVCSTWTDSPLTSLRASAFSLLGSLLLQAHVPCSAPGLWGYMTVLRIRLYLSS